MASDILTDRERSTLLPALPVIARADTVDTIRSKYEGLLREAGDNCDDDFFAQGVAVGIGRAVIKHRVKQARETEVLMRVDDAVREEYGELFASLDLNTSSSPEQRADRFIDGQYLPSFELFVRHGIGERTQALSTIMAERVFQATAMDHELRVDLEDNALRTRIKVMKILNRDEKQFGIVRAKIDGLSMQRDDGQQIDLKFRRSGVVRLDLVDDKDIVTDFKILENLETDKSVPLDRVEVFRRELVDYLLATNNYRPVIERAYMTRTLPSNP